MDATDSQPTPPPWHFTGDSLTGPPRAHPHDPQSRVYSPATIVAHLPADDLPVSARASGRLSSGRGWFQPRTTQLGGSGVGIAPRPFVTFVTWKPCWFQQFETTTTGNWSKMRIPRWLPPVYKLGSSVDTAATRRGESERVAATTLSRMVDEALALLCVRALTARR